MVNWSNLPKELINIIINYTDVVVYRYGKYIDRINKNDSRYKIIQKRNLPIWFSNNKWLFYFKLFDFEGIERRGLVMIHQYNHYTREHYLTKREMIKNDDGTSDCEKNTDYKVDLQGEYKIIVNYTM
jgi:hypothetical protein